jgi:PAS domain S-box-containing protein
MPERYRTREDLEDALDEARTSEAQLRKIIDTIPTLAWCNLPDGSNEFLNLQWHEYTGLSPQKAHGGGWKAAIHPDDLPRLMEQSEALRDLDKPGGCEVRLRRSDGVFRWFLFRREPLRDETGAVIRWYGMATDIEDRKQTESLRAAEKRTLEMIADGASLKDILNHLCTCIDVQISPSVTTVLLMDPDGKRLWHSAGPLVPREWVSVISPVPVALEAGLCGTAAFLKARVIVTDVATDPGWPDGYRDLAIRNGIRAAWSEPILTKDNQVLGTFALYCSESRVPTDADLALIEGAGRIALIAIERQRSQEALRGALDDIRKSEAKLRRVIDTIPALAWCNLPDGSNEFLNKRWHAYTGLSPEESHGWGWQASIHPEDLQQLMDKWRELLASGEPGEIEARLRRRDGAFRWFLIRVEPLRDETGKIVKWYGTSTDIENLKQTEKKLREDERDLRRITDAIPQTIVVQDPSGAPLYANQAVLDYTGLTIEDVVAPHFRERMFHPDDLERLRYERKAALKRGLPFEIEQRALRKDGQYRWFLIHYNPFRDEQGNLVRWYATGTDIDDRKRAEDRMRNENLALREAIDRSSMYEAIVGSSETLRRVLSQIDKVAPTDSTVLILGETGTGKELIASTIHKRSKRSARAFIRVNCAAIPASLIASELFGHEKGAFTGALQRRAGRFESADGGTIFLDEIGDLSPETQISLLRVLQEREFERVGSSQPISIDVRVLAATNRDLEAAVSAGTFRRDLFYRLNVFPVRIPSLRERKDDIPLLVEYLVERYAKSAGKKISHMKKKTLDLFQAYDWPGNIRELQNVVERAVILCDGETFTVDETWLQRKSNQLSVQHVSRAGVLAEDKKEFADRERIAVEAALAECQGQVSGPRGAAVKLGIPRQTLEWKIASLGIEKRRFKVPSPRQGPV